jgi:hypothetical protein
VHILKPSRLDVIPGQPDVVCAEDAPQGPAQAAAWLEYPFRKSHPILRWLPTKLAAWNRRGSPTTLDRSTPQERR